MADPKDEMTAKLQEMQSTPQPAPVDHSILDQDWAALAPEKKAQLAALVQKLDGAKVWQGGGNAMGVGDSKAFSGIAALGGLPQDQLTALARFKMYQNLTGGDPNWQGPTQIPTGARQAGDTASLYGKTAEQAYQMQQGRYDSLAKPGSGTIALKVPPQEQAAAMPEQPPADDSQAIGKSFLQMIMDLAKGKK